MRFSSMERISAAQKTVITVFADPGHIHGLQKHRDIFRKKSVPLKREH